MNNNQEYLEKMRKQGVSDPDIKKMLAGRGWRQDEINDLFAPGDDIPPPPHTLQSTSASSPQPAQPVAVVQRYTTIGIEYAVMFLALGFGAVSLGILLHALVDASFFNGDLGQDASLGGVAALVTIPIFITLFMRLKRLSAADPTVRADASRRKWVQLTLLVSFVWGIGTLVYYLWGLINSFTGGTAIDYSYAYGREIISPAAYQAQQFIHAVITVGIAGSIFSYYWHDEHTHQS